MLLFNIVLSFIKLYNLVEFPFDVGADNSAGSASRPYSNGLRPADPANGANHANGTAAGTHPDGLHAQQPTGAARRYAHPPALRSPASQS